MMNWAKWNAPWDTIPLGAGFNVPGAGYFGGGGSIKACFFVLTFDSTAVNAITGTTYDPTNHYTTTIPLSNVAGKTLLDLWGIKTVHQIIWNNGSSDVQVQTAGGATFRTGEVKGRLVENGQYIELKIIGCGGTADPLTSQDEAEIDTTAGAMSALSFTGILFGS